MTLKSWSVFSSKHFDKDDIKLVLVILIKTVNYDVMLSICQTLCCLGCTGFQIYGFILYRLLGVR